MAESTMGPQKAMRPVSLRASLRLDVRRAAPSSAAVIIVEARDPFTQGELQGGAPVLTDPRVDAKKTQPPPRYNEGTLVDAMQNAWRFVTDDALRERRKEAKGSGTPATRAEIIKGLKRQHLLAADGKLVVPTPAGLQLFELLKGAAPALVDPGTTAVWEMRLDEVVTGRVHFKGVIDEIAAEAGKLIAILRRHTGALVDLSRPAAIAARRGETTDGLLHSRRRRPCATFDVSNCNNLRMKPRNYRHRARAPAPPGARLGAGNGGVARSIRPDGALSLPRSGLWSHGHPRPSCAARRVIRPRRGRGHRSRPASHLVHGRRL